MAPQLQSRISTRLTDVTGRACLRKDPRTGSIELLDPIHLAFDTGPGNALIDDWVHRKKFHTPASDTVLRIVVGSSLLAGSPTRI